MQRRYFVLATLIALLASGVLVFHAGSASPIVRTVDVGYGPTSMISMASTGRVFISTVELNGGIVVLDSATGRKMSSMPLDPLPVGAGQGTSSLEADGDRLTLWRPPRELLTLDPKTGAVLQQGSSAPPGSTAMGEHPVHMIAVASDDSALLVRDATGQAPVRRVGLPRNLTGITIDARLTRIYVTTADGALKVLDGYQGKVLRTVHLQARVESLLVSEATRHLFVLASTRTDYTLLMLDAASGQLLRTIRTPVAVTAPLLGSLNPPAFLIEIDDSIGQLVLTTQSSDRLWLFNTRTGDPMGAVSIGMHPTTWGIDQPHHHLLVVSTNSTIGNGYPTGPGTLWVLDLRTDHLIDKIPVGTEPVAIVLDERTGRAFVANANVNPDFTPLTFHSRQSWWQEHGSQVHQWLPFLPAPATPINTGTVTVIDLNRL